MALGKEGWNRLRAGDVEGAIAAFRAQISLCPVNPEPHVALGLMAARQGDREAALRYVRAAVVRGFTDLRRIERAEVWGELGGHPKFLELQDAVPRLLAIERRWAGWDAVRAGRAPDDLAKTLKEREEIEALVDRMAPVLGDRYVRLWKRLSDRTTAALLEAYVARHDDAPDLGDALSRLMTLYTRGSSFRWTVAPSDVARRVGAVATTVLARFGDSPLRPGALACRALALYSERDRKGRLAPDALEGIRASLSEILERHRDSPFVLPAAEGLVRSEMEFGQADRAAETYRAFVAAHRGDASRIQDLRGRLGVLALWAGGMPEFAAETLDGGTLTAAGLRGKVVVVDFWATWCRPCVDQLSTLRRIVERHPDDVVVLGVNLDGGDEIEREALRSWIARENVPGRQIHDGRGWDSELVGAFGAREIPFSVVVGRNGAVLAVNEHGRDLEKAVRAALD